MWGMTYFYDFNPRDYHLRSGTVSVIGYVGPDELMLEATGPMFDVLYDDTHQIVGAHWEELTPLMGGTPELDWGPWWDREDMSSDLSVASYDETGVWLTRRQVYEQSMAAAHRRVWARR